MNNTDFQKVLDNRIKKVRELLEKKGEEYASDTDRLHNFKRAAEIERTTPEEALWGMFVKHLVSVIDLIENSQAKIPTRELLEEKCIDSINYFILLSALFEERIIQSENKNSEKLKTK